MHARVLLCSYQNTKLEVPSFTDSKDMIWGKILKMGHVTLTTLIRVTKAGILFTLLAYKIWRLASAVPEIW